MAFDLTPSWTMVSLFLLLAFGYLIASILSGFLAGKWVKGIDLREYDGGTVSGSMVREHFARWAVVLVGPFDIYKGRLPARLNLRSGMGETTGEILLLVDSVAASVNGTYAEAAAFF